MPSFKTFRTKRTLAKKQKQNRSVPNWMRLRTEHRKWHGHNNKKRRWRSSKLGL